MSKFRIAIGSAEVEYDGPDEFLKDEIPALVSAFLKLFDHESLRSVNPVQKGLGAVSASPLGLGASSIDGTTGTLAAKLGVKTGPDLIFAASARLTFVLKKETFTRDEILAEAKSAAAYYTESYRKHLSQHLNGLVRAGKLIERSKDVYSLPADARKTLETQLA